MPDARIIDSPITPTIDFDADGFHTGHLQLPHSHDGSAYGSVMIPVASIITSMFLEQVADAVEAKHYPHLPSADAVPLGEAARDTLNFLGLLVVANIVALLLYLILPFAAVFIFWGLNGFLLGREYFTLAAMRRVGRVNAKALRRKHAGTIWLAGVLMTVPLTVPLVNLIIPILGAATFTNLFHLLEGKEA